jgi:hypothetical protein
MDIQSLPKYRGLLDSPRAWGEQDEEGKTARMRLRDYVVLSFMIMICFPISLCLVFHFWDCHRNAEMVNSARENQMEQVVRRSLF